MIGIDLEMSDMTTRDGAETGMMGAIVMTAAAQNDDRVPGRDHIDLASEMMVMEEGVRGHENDQPSKAT